MSTELWLWLVLPSAANVVLGWALLYLLKPRLDGLVAMLDRHCTNAKRVLEERP